MFKSIGESLLRKFSDFHHRRCWSYVFAVIGYSFIFYLFIFYSFIYSFGHRLLFNDITSLRITYMPELSESEIRIFAGTRSVKLEFYTRVHNPPFTFNIIMRTCLPPKIYLYGSSFSAGVRRVSNSTVHPRSIRELIPGNPLIVRTTAKNVSTRSYIQRSSRNRDFAFFGRDGRTRTRGKR